MNHKELAQKIFIHLITNCPNLIEEPKVAGLNFVTDPSTLKILAESSFNMASIFEDIYSECSSPSYQLFKANAEK